MHIPDGYLGPTTSGFFYVVMLAVWTSASKIVKKTLKAKQVPQGSVIVAGKNFGCGSSREQAVSTLKGYELVIVAKGFARIFTQNAVNLGLNIVEVPAIAAAARPPGPGTNPMSRPPTRDAAV